MKNDSTFLNSDGALILSGVVGFLLSDIFVPKDAFDSRSLPSIAQEGREDRDERYGLGGGPSTTIAIGGTR